MGHVAVHRNTVVLLKGAAQIILTDKEASGKCVKTDIAVDILVEVSNDSRTELTLADANMLTSGNGYIFSLTADSGCILMKMRV